MSGLLRCGCMRWMELPYLLARMKSHWHRFIEDRSTTHKTWSSWHKAWQLTVYQQWTESNGPGLKSLYSNWYPACQIDWHMWHVDGQIMFITRVSAVIMFSPCVFVTCQNLHFGKYVRLSVCYLPKFTFWQVCSFVGLSVCLSVSLSVLSSITDECFDISSPNLVHIWNGWAVPVCDIDK